MFSVFNYKYTKQDIWNYVAKKKLINNSKYILYFQSRLCFVDNAANAWPSLNELHDVDAWNIMLMHAQSSS